MSKKELKIISCSRRTDIPAFYYPWLQESLKRRFVLVQNPYTNQSTQVDLSPDKVHSIVLWSKNFGHVINDPQYLKDYCLYFQFTITGYSKKLEQNVIDSIHAVKQMEVLANRYSPNCINWRFDPIMLGVDIEKEPTPDKVGRARLKMFESLCQDISSFGVKRCTISFVSLYNAVESRLRKFDIHYLNLSEELQEKFASELVEIANKYGITIYSCANPIIENVPGVQKGHCIDGALLERLFQKPVTHAKDTGQREACGCTKSIDIASYNLTCKHRCLYCYSNSSQWM